MNSAWVHPVLLLRHFTQLAVLIGGERVTAGLGTGWNTEEFDVVGLTLPRFGARMDRLDEVLRLARTLYDDGVVSFDGQHVVARDLPLSPVPAAPPRLLLGGGSDRVLRMAGRYADVLDLHGDPKHGRVAGATMAQARAGDVQRRALTTVEDLAGRIGLVHAAAAEAGRPRVAVSTQIRYVAFARSAAEVRAAEEELCAVWARMPYRPLDRSPYLAGSAAFLPRGAAVAAPRGGAAMTDVECMLDARAELGECPVWAADEQALYWVDIYAPSLNRLDPATRENHTWPMPDTIGSFGLRAAGGAVLALRDGFYLFDFETGKATLLAAPDAWVSGTRFNDGKVSPDGRFFAGTMDEERLERPIGALFWLDPDGTVRPMFHSDSKGQVVWVYDYEPTDGSIANRRVVARPTQEIGRPDGAATDVEEFYWSAGISAGVVNRWAPDGRLDRTILMPCSNPTMPCFGGPDLKTIYVTSMRYDVPTGVLAATPLSGGILALRVDVPGVPVARFAG